MINDNEFTPNQIDQIAQRARDLANEVLDQLWDKFRDAVDRIDTEEIAALHPNFFPDPFDHSDDDRNRMMDYQSDIEDKIRKIAELRIAAAIIQDEVNRQVSI